MLRILAFFNRRLLFGKIFVYNPADITGLSSMLHTCDPTSLPISALHVGAPLRVGCRWARFRSSELNEERYNPPESAGVSRDRLRNRNGYLRENETRTRRDESTKGDGGSKGLRMNVTINLSLSEEERNSRRCIHIRVSDREWKRLSSKIDAILRYHASCLFSLSLSFFLHALPQSRSVD